MKTAVVLLAIALSAPVAAQDRLPPIDRFDLGVGLYAADHDLDTRWDASDGSRGARVDFQRDLGFADRQDALAWRIGGSLGTARRHTFDAFGYDYDDTSMRVLDRMLEIGDNVYPVDASFEGRLDLDITGVAYTWMFLHDGRQAAGIGLGAMRYDIRADLDASATLAGTPAAYANDLSEDAWAPMLRVEYVRSLSMRWRWGAALAYTRKKGGAVSGDAFDAQVALDYLPWRHLGFSLRYNYNNVDLDLRRTRFDGNIHLNNRGPQLLTLFRF